MSLSDGDVAVLARQAVDLLSAEAAIDIEPVAGDDPYRWGPSAWLVWPLVDGRREFAVRIDSGQAAAEALAQLIDRLGEYVSEAPGFWGQAFPVCPGHPHPAEVAVDGVDVVLRCPDTGREVRRIAPDLPV
ncbi:MAG TPA: hypothetical protein VFH38_06990 [Jatrophihabitans sp.]|nr:hypothetical protein [Jatrophihabitans sp.]